MGIVINEPPPDFSSRLRDRGEQAKGTITGEVISDTHIGAPYADPGMPEKFFEEKLGLNKKAEFCVLLGDIFEFVNLAVKDLPNTPEEARDLRKERIFDYIRERHIHLEDEEMQSLKRRLPVIREDEMNRLLGFEPGSKGEATIRHIFRKTRVRSEVESEAIAHHMKDLKKLVSDHPHCTFYYVVGNHERMPEFLDAVYKTRDELNHASEAAGGKERLIVTEKYFKMGDALFVHGDQQMTPSKYKVDGPDKFTEQEVESKRKFVLQVGHDKANKWIPLMVGEIIHKAEQCAEHVISWFDKNSPETLEGVTHIFMGHTHFPFTNVKIIDAMTANGGHVMYCAHPGESIEGNPRLLSGREFIFHNTGAAIERLPHFNQKAFNPLEITLKAPESPQPHTDPLSYYEGFTVENVRQYGQPERQRA